jgi:hypothetical protein
MKAALRTPLTPVPHVCLGHVCWAIAREDAPHLRTVLVASGRDATLDQVRIAKERLRSALPAPGDCEAFCGDVDLSLPLWPDGLPLHELLRAVVETEAWPTLAGGGLHTSWWKAQQIVRGLDAWLVGVLG